MIRSAWPVHRDAPASGYSHENCRTPGKRTRGGLKCNWDNFETPQEKAERECEERSPDGQFNQRDKEDKRREIERVIERRSGDRGRPNKRR